MSTSLRLSEELKKRVARLAASRDTTPHALMVEAIEEKLDAEESHAAFIREAEGRLSRMKKAGTGIPADEVFAYFQQRAAGRPVRRPKARRL